MGLLFMYVYVCVGVSVWKISGSLWFCIQHTHAHTLSHDGGSVARFVTGQNVQIMTVIVAERTAAQQLTFQRDDPVEMNRKYRQ